jgi:hypothetical protein
MCNPPAAASPLPGRWSTATFSKRTGGEPEALRRSRSFTDFVQPVAPAGSAHRRPASGHADLVARASGRRVRAGFLAGIAGILVCAGVLARVAVAMDITCGGERGSSRARAGRLAGTLLAEHRPLSVPVQRRGVGFARRAQLRCRSAVFGPGALRTSREAARYSRPPRCHVRGEDAALRRLVERYGRGVPTWLRDTFLAHPSCTRRMGRHP